jgi:hypothetical protein
MRPMYCAAVSAVTRTDVPASGICIEDWSAAAAAAAAG